MAIFEKLLDEITPDFSQLDTFEALVELRAEFAIHHALRGFDLEYDTALEMLRTSNDNLTEAEIAQKNIVTAAIDNLIDFAAASQYQMMSELYDAEDADEEESSEEESDEEKEEELSELALAIFTKYNDRYAYTENLDIEYAMIIAAQLLSVSETTILTYMTQGDERVRPWHLQYEGYSAPKSKFPAWLIPPIEHACRCYLVEDTSTIQNAIAGIQNKKAPQMPDWFNRTFKESVALGGRIFSDEHPYFQVSKRHVKPLQAITERIKNKYFNG